MSHVIGNPVLIGNPVGHVITFDEILLEATHDTSVPSQTIMQEPAPSTKIRHGPTPSFQRVHGRTAKTSKLLRPAERLTWNCYRCDHCGFTHKNTSDVTRHIQRQADHDPLTVSASWVGDANVKLARGFISGEPLWSGCNALQDSVKNAKFSRGRPKTRFTKTAGRETLSLINHEYGSSLCPRNSVKKFARK
ncbi:hypothetical protein BGX38DRAFT_1260151 [Terfezia claveryi]|nr:hypothetical protein BGX38DRAFT_1260151 [Terfezia claveryi]